MMSSNVVIMDPGRRHNWHRTTLYVTRDTAFAERDAAYAVSHTARRVRVFGPMPGILYEVHAEGVLRYLTDPVDVHNVLARDPKGVVRTLPVHH